MAEAQDTFRNLLVTIAEEQDFKEYTTNIEPVSSGGSNHTSHLLAATLTAPEKYDLHLFAKVCVLGEKFRAIVPTQHYTIEQYFYTDFIPKYKQIEEKFNIPTEHKFMSAKFYSGSTEYLKEILVLENLTARGFESFNRFQSIDWPYASYSIKQLALFHALSVAYSKYYSSEYENFLQDTFYKFAADLINDTLQKCINRAIEYIKKKNRKRFITFFENPENKKPVHKLFQKPTHEFSVTIHGDYRPSNIMHKVLNDGSLQVISLDYQTIQQGRPVVDLLYFIVNGSDKEFRKQYMQKSLDLYYTEFTSALRRFELQPEEIYKKSTYEEDIKELLPHTLTSSFLYLQIITIDESNAPRVDNDFDIDQFNIAPNKLYIQRINDLIDDFIDMGVL